MDRPPMERAVSTDVVMGIVMSHLKVRNLLNCRKVSKFWNKIASSALRKRSTMMKNITSQAQLIELEECMRASSDFPFAGLKFLQPWRLSSAAAIGFLRNHGPRFTRLHLLASFEPRIKDLAPFMNNLPRLSVLEVSYSWAPTPDAGLLKHAAGQDDGRILNLPSLCILRISCEMNQDFLLQVCMAASPSLQIECLNATHRMLKSLERVGKLQAVSVMKIYEDDDRDDPVLGQGMFLSTESLTLTKLDFNARGCISLDGLMKLLIASQHSLKELCLDRINPFKFSLECPVLTKLTKLSLCIFNLSCDENVFQGSQGNKFPALKELKLDTVFHEYHPWIGNFSDDLFIVPSLTMIDLSGRFDINVIKDLARSFPNVIEIRLKSRYRYYKNYPSDVWSVGEFKFLEKLKIWDYPVRRSSKKYMNMDRLLTGLPMAICKKLRKKAQQNLTDSPFKKILKKSRGILQLKNLKELVVCVKLDNKLEEFPEEPSYISMVSVWYALQMMPNLQARFVYEPPSLSRYFGFGEEERDKTVAALKAAFKPVQPYVELEPFFS